VTPPDQHPAERRHRPQHSPSPPLLTSKPTQARDDAIHAVGRRG
jgi:hypothetical protein